MSKSILYDKSFKFGVNIYDLCRQIQEVYREKIITTQLMRSGTSISANLAEAKYGESKADFIHKMKISLKEANESLHWIEMLRELGYLPEQAYVPAKKKITEIIKMLSSSVRTAQKNK